MYVNRVAAAAEAEIEDEERFYGDDSEDESDESVLSEDGGETPADEETQNIEKQEE